MTETTVVDEGAPSVLRPPATRRRPGRLLGIIMPSRRAYRRRSRVSVTLAITWTVFVVLVALTVQWLPLHSPTLVAGTPNLGLNWSSEFLGTDGIGRSNLSRIAFGARASLGISLMACTVAVIVGGLLGLLTAYFGSWFTVIIDILTNSILAVPSLLLLLAIILALQPTIQTLTLSLSLIFVPAIMRLTRANAQTQLSREYVTAARLIGASPVRLMFREVLPNSIMPLISYAALVIPSLIVTEGSLSFLGHGVQPPTPSWGSMIAAAQLYINESPAPALIPCFILFLTVLSLNTIGDALRVRLDVREAQI